MTKTRRPLLLAGSAALALLALLLASAGGPLVALPDGAAQAYATITLAIVLQALPFLLLGVIVSGVIAAFVPAHWLALMAPRSPYAAVCMASVGGIVLPGCECASVPVSQALIRRGLPQPAALVFMLAAPAVNPIVLVATAIAFPAQPMMVWARLAAALLASTAIGWLWVAFAKDSWMKPQGGPLDEPSRTAVFRETVVHDLLQAGGFLVLGALAAAAVKVLVPRGVLVTLADNPALAVGVMAVLALVLALCSEADAFIAASFTAVSPTAQLVFMTIGPMADIKLAMMQTGAFGGRFTARFMPLTIAVCTLSALLVGGLLLGG